MSRGRAIILIDVGAKYLSQVSVYADMANDGQFGANQIHYIPIRPMISEMDKSYHGSCMPAYDARRASIAASFDYEGATFTPHNPVVSTL